MGGSGGPGMAGLAGEAGATIEGKGSAEIGGGRERGMGVGGSGGVRGPSLIW